MVVDDERDIQWLFQQKFRRELRGGQIEFHFAFSAEEALNYLRHQAVADVVLILSDINMPGMTGLELIKKIKEQFSTLKVCMITAYDDEQNYQQAMEYGADDYITKPIDFEKLRKDVLGLEKE
jgi:CheY-like chemotaxis protein